MRKTKIICTLGPSTDDEAVLHDLMISGMDVARFNFSHQGHEEHKKRLDRVCKLRKKYNLPIATLLDTKGPEIRLGTFAGGKAMLETGSTFTLTTEEIIGDEARASITFKQLPGDVQRGTKLLIDDGLIELKVLETTDTEITCQVVYGGPVSDRKSVNVPGTVLSMPYMSDKDRADIKFGVENDFDFIAASFVRTADDVLMLRNELKKNGDSKIRVIAKIENAQGVENIDEILRVSDGIMVARGDMGVEIPFEEIPAVQKKLIKKAYKAGKQVITATQMLETMIKNPRPTRAEMTDIANAIYDGTSAIMLSGETAAGLFPIEAVKTMALIAERTERDIDYKKRFRTREINDVPNVTNAISHATCTTAHDLGAKAIITVTKSGETAKMISKFRPDCPIISCTTSEKVWRQMNLSWGVIPLMVKEKNSTDELFDHAVETAFHAGLVHNGDLCVITAGVPLGVSGTTNLLKVHIVGDVLVSATSITSLSVCGNLCVCHDEEDAIQNFREGDILVIPYTSNNILSLMKKASGIICELDGVNSHAAVVGLALEKPVIVGAKNATSILKSGTTVTLDAGRGIVYTGIKKS